MLVFEDIKSLQSHLAGYCQKKSIGFVPTMGALHKGHLSLINTSISHNDYTVASIFVNPTQFNNSNDLKNYPRTISNDLALLKEVGCDIVFIPTAAEMYKDNLTSEKFDFDGLELPMEGAFRLGHFDGVGTIVKRFFQIIKPTRAYFGEKDFQQLQIIRKMVEKQKLKVQIVPCNIYRESDGLAMSSRNALLSKKHRLAAPFIYHVLKEIQSNFTELGVAKSQQFVKNKFETHNLLKLEYFEIAKESTLLPAKSITPQDNLRAFIAVFAGDIRLIDNIQL
ncbi:pantoate--beta-alanine ligase [Urechidicola sp. KH5]